MIIFCEKTYAEERLKTGFTRNMSRVDLTILAKYFRYIGKSEPQIKESLENFCEKYGDLCGEKLYEIKIHQALLASKKSPLRIFSPVGITQKELDAIRYIPEFRYQKILFLLLFVGKAFHNPEYKEYYINHKITQIFTLAGMNPTREQRELVEDKIEDSGLMTTTLNGTWRINFIDEDQNYFPILIQDFNNPLKYLNFVCSVCKKEIEQKNNNQVYCGICAKNRRKEQDRLRK
jgi:hypothetical protein